jgi:nicotinate dehydrogenase subunit A
MKRLGFYGKPSSNYLAKHKSSEKVKEMRFSLKVNGIDRECDVAPSTSLLAVLRDVLGLTGTRYGCGYGVCGACCVLLNGRSVTTCNLSIEESAGKEITTVEGLATEGKLHVVQRSFLEEDAMQCGFCTSGMLISAVALLLQKSHPHEDEIRNALAPHLCRCGVYLRVIRAVKRAAG